MDTIEQNDETVKSKRRRGRPRLRSPEKEKEIISACVESAIIAGRMPGDIELGQRVGLGERTVRDIRLKAGLDRRQVAEWVKKRTANEVSSSEEEGEVLCRTAYAGLWLLLPLLMVSVLRPAARLLTWTGKTGIDAWQWVTTIVMWTVLGFRRFSHLDDFRHEADLGLALFTGRTRLLSDSSVWRLVHGLTAKSAQAFYRQTAAEAVPVEVPGDDEWISMDEHVVESFTKLKPRPLGKTRVPTRGRSYPAIRLYAPFHLGAGRFLGLVVTEARRALSQVLPTLIAEVRKLREMAGHPQAKRVDIIIDRGGYKGSLFEALMADEDNHFIAMARATKKNLRQWEAIPDDQFVVYQPEGEDNPNLKITDTTTRITNCRYPLRTILIRDDTPDTKQPWRPIFTSRPVEEMSPAEVDATYRRRQHHENSFAELDHFLAGKCLPKAYALVRAPNDQGEKRQTTATIVSAETMTGLHFVSWLRHWCFNLLKDFGAALGAPYETMRVGSLVRKFIVRPGALRLKDDKLWITLEPFTGCHALLPWIQRLNQQQLALPWLGDLTLQIEIASIPAGLASDLGVVRRRIFANQQLPRAA
jgi:hypothetical protein